jgi:hypothetical protein
LVDLCNTKTNISIAQFNQVDLCIKKELKKNPMSVRKAKSMKTTSEVKASPPLDVHPIEMEMMIIY